MTDIPLVKKKIDTYRKTPINAERMSIKDEVLAWGHNVLNGKFYLKGNNPITENGLWPLLQKVKSEQGWCALVKSAEVYRVASIMNLIVNDAGEVEKIKVNYLNRFGGISEKGTSKTEGDELTNPQEFAILLNNMDRTPNFNSSMQGLKLLDAIYQSAAFDLEVSRPRLFIETHFYPSEAQKLRIKENVDAFNMIVYASLGDGKPMTFHPWKPESKQPILKDMWDWQFGLFRRLNGIAYNTSRKEDTHRTSEVKMVGEQFESIENIWQQEIEIFLRNCYKNFGGEEYTLERDGEIVFQVGSIIEKQKEVVEKEEKNIEETEKENIDENKKEDEN